MNKESKYITVKEVRQILHIPRSTVYRLISKEKIQSIKVGGKIMCLADNIEHCRQHGTNISGEDTFSPADRRQHSRINTYINSSYTIDLGPKLITGEGIMQNLSIGGVFLNDAGEELTGIYVDDPIDLKFFLPINKGNRKEVVIKGRILRKYNNGLALKFRQVDSTIKSAIKKHVG